MDYKINVQRVAESEGSNLRAFASIIFESSFKVSDVRIYEGKNGLFVSMPNYNTHTVDKDNRAIYENLCNPITKEFHAHLTENILQCYQENRADHSVYERDCSYGEEGLNVSANITPYTQEGRDILGIGSFTLNDSFVIKNVVVHKSEKGNWVSMPSMKKREDYQDVCFPVTKDFRAELTKTILDSYEKNLAKTLDEPAQETKQQAATHKPPKQEHKKSR